MSTVLAFLALLATSVECGISTSPFGVVSDPEEQEECTGGWY
jgi:hypothetical protein